MWDFLKHNSICWQVGRKDGCGLGRDSWCEGTTLGSLPTSIHIAGQFLCGFITQIYSKSQVFGGTV